MTTNKRFFMRTWMIELLKDLAWIYQCFVGDGSR